MNEMTPEKLHEWADHPVTTALSAKEIHVAASAWEADRARIEKLEINVATWRALASPIWVGDESEGHFVCLTCNQEGADDGGPNTIQHLSGCEYAEALAKAQEA